MSASLVTDIEDLYISTSFCCRYRVYYMSVPLFADIQMILHACFSCCRYTADHT